jgi:hypothetical protein
MVDCNYKNSTKNINRPDSIGERNYLVNVGFGMNSVQRKLLFNVLSTDLLADYNISTYKLHVILY